MNRKNIYFLNGLPRAGNTLLGSIINQNPNFCMSANSIVPDMLGELYMLQQTDIYKNFPDEKAFQNVTTNLFDNYYQDYPQQYILDRAPWGLPINLKFLKMSRPGPIKVIVLVRDVLEVLASFIKWGNENPTAFVNQIVDCFTVEQKCDALMNNEGQIVKELIGVKHLMLPQNEGISIQIEYDDLVSNPEEQVNRIYDFLGVPKFKHQYENLSQFSVNNLKYNDKVLGERLHTIKTEMIKKEQYKVEDILPKSVIDKYGNLNFWRKENN